MKNNALVASCANSPKGCAFTTAGNTITFDVLGSMTYYFTVTNVMTTGSMKFDLQGFYIIFYENKAGAPSVTSMTLGAGQNVTVYAFNNDG